MKHICYLLMVFGVTLSSISVNAQINTLWEAYYTPANDTLDIEGTKTDADGNLYTYGSEGRNLFLQKLNKQGALEWTITNNTLITPVPGDPYTENHLLQWAKITDVATNIPGNYVVITGKARFFNFGGTHHCFILKFNLSGDTVWSRTYDNPDLSYRGRINTSSNPKILYAYNSLFLNTLTVFAGSGNDDILLSRLDVNNGNILNYKNFSSKAVAGEYIAAFSIKNGNFYISGSYFTGSGLTDGGWGTFIIRLDTAFNRIDEGFEGHPASRNYVIQHEVDNNGNIYVLAQTQDSVHSFNKSITCIKYNSSGSRLWRFDYNDTINSHDSALTFSVDEASNIRIIGQSDNHNRSLFILLDSSGNLQSVLKRNSTGISTQRIHPAIREHWLCIGCPPSKPVYYVPAVNIENSTYYFNSKTQNKGVSKTYNNTKHWWDVDTLLVPGYTPMNIVFTDTFDFVTVALIDTLTDKKIQYRKYRDTSWLKIPFNLTTTAFSLHEIRLVWSALPDYKTDFIIERGLNDKDYIIIDTVSKQTLEYIDSNLDKNTLYYYRIRSVNQFGASLPSIPDSDITFDDVGIENSLFTKTVKIYPNPTYNPLFIDFSEKGNYEIIVVDITGKKQFITHTKEMKNEMNLGELKSGVYFLRINNAENQQSFTFKLVKP